MSSQNRIQSATKITKVKRSRKSLEFVIRFFKIKSLGNLLSSSAAFFSTFFSAMKQSSLFKYGSLYSHGRKIAHDDAEIARKSDPLQCPHCEKVFANSKALGSHVHYKHSDHRSRSPVAARALHFGQASSSGDALIPPVLEAGQGSSNASEGCVAQAPQDS